MISIPYSNRQIHGVLVALVLASCALAQTPPPAPKATTPAPLPPAPLPVALYLTWQHDPVTTMTVHWHTDWTEGFTDTVLDYRSAGGNAEWSRATGAISPTSMV